MPAFTIEHLDEHKLLDAWPVLRSSGEAAMAEWWENEARDLLRRGGGVLAARAPDGSIHGIASYECRHRPEVGRVLHVDRLVTFELSRKRPARQALTDALSLTARAFCCRALMLPLSRTLAREGR